MEARTGVIHRFNSDQEATDFMERTSKKLIPLEESEAEELGKLPKRRRKNKMRNKPCLCGSGKKFKYCCWSQYA